jgi:hypothetical protein
VGIGAGKQGPGGAPFGNDSIEAVALVRQPNRHRRGFEPAEAGGGMESELERQQAVGRQRVEHLRLDRLGIGGMQRGGMQLLAACDVGEIG